MFFQLKNTWANLVSVESFYENMNCNDQNASVKCKPCITFCLEMFSSRFCLIPERVDDVANWDSNVVSDCLLSHTEFHMR